MSEVKTWQHRLNDADFHATREELMQAEIDELRAHISALESQEPIGEVSGSDWSTALLWKDREPGSPVYAEAGAAPDADYAAMYAWLRKQHWSDNVVAVVQFPKDTVKLGSYAPSGDLLDAFIREAMTKENL